MKRRKTSSSSERWGKCVDTNEQQLILIDAEGQRLRIMVSYFDEVSRITLFFQTMIQCGLLCYAG